MHPKKSLGSVDILETDLGPLQGILCRNKGHEEIIEDDNLVSDI